MIKTQVLVGGRGKAGVVRYAGNSMQAYQITEQVLGSKIKNYLINKLLVQETVDFKKEYYLGITIDRAEKKVVMITSPSGGMDIEEIAQESPEKIFKVYANPFIGLQNYQAYELSLSLCQDQILSVKIVKIIRSLYMGDRK